MSQLLFTGHRAGHFAQPAATLTAIALLAILIRTPFNANTGVDEAFYLIVGRQWLHGLPPYAGSFDVKPPLLFLLMASAQALLGATLLAAKALVSGAVALTACGLYLFGRRLTGELAGAAAAIFYIGSTLTLGGTFSPAELIMAPFTTFAMLFGLPALFDSGRIRVPALLASGLLFGAAACVKHTAVFQAAPFALVLLINRQGVERLRALGLFAAGACIVPAGFAAYFLAIGHFGDLVNDAALSAIRRAGVGYMPWSKAIRLLTAGMLTVLPVIAMAGIFWVERRALRNHPAYPSIRFLGTWTAGILLGIFVTKGMFFIYTLPLLQPLSLAAGGFVQHVLGRIQSRERRWFVRTGVLAAAAAYAYLVVAHLFLAGDGSVKSAEAAAALMLREGKRSGDRILVVDRDLPVYVAAGAEPPLSIFHPLHLLCDFPLKGAETALADSMERKPAFVVLADAPVTLPCENPGRRASIEARLAQDYCALGNFESSITDWPGSFTVYGLKARARGGRASCPSVHL